jgi:hypothetical protein
MPSFIVTKLRHSKYVGWEKLPKDFFTYLSGINMSTISLNNNNFIHFIGTSFKSFSNIHKIYMRSNEIVFVQADGLQQLKNLDLESNDIFRMPKFCFNICHLRESIIFNRCQTVPVQYQSS